MGCVPECIRNQPFHAILYGLSYDSSLRGFDSQRVLCVSNSRSEEIVTASPFQHESHDDSRNTSPHDIALVKLKTPLTYSDVIKPVCLPSPGLTYAFSNDCYAIGWGYTHGNHIIMKGRAFLTPYDPPTQ